MQHVRLIETGWDRDLEVRSSDAFDPVPGDHEVVVDSWCSRVGNKSMTIEHHIYANGECATTCSTIIVGFDRKTRAAIALPESWQPTDSSKIPPPPAR